MFQNQSQKIVIDGEERDIPVIRLGERAGMKIGEAIEQLYRTLNGSASVISAIRIDGVEITASNEMAFAPLELSNVGSIEIDTVAPAALTEDTLKTLDEFLIELSGISERLADRITPENSLHREFLALVDGVQTICEAIQVSQKALIKAGRVLPSVVNLLEADLNSILADLLESKIAGHTPYVRDLLAKHLPANLREWSTQGIPAFRASSAPAAVESASL